MYIWRIDITNIRSFKNLEVLLPPCGWNVVIGDNGSGKSTFLRSAALALVGPDEANALRQDWKDWLRYESALGKSILTLHMDLLWDKITDNESPPDRMSVPMLLAFIGFERSGDSVRLLPLWSPRGATHFPQVYPPHNHIWSGKPGWFSAAYGPFRRFAGGDKESEKLFSSKPRLAAHLSVFGEEIALTECLKWLQELKFKQLEEDPEGDLLDSVIKFINQTDFLPHQVRLTEVSSKGVEFVDGNGFRLPVEELSDGYRSILSMTFELIRQMSRTYAPKSIFDPKDPTRIIAPGVVLIDEIDAHLHPTWQRRIGGWFTKHFPALQFIVTTHSPLVCQSAASVYRLPRPGSDEKGRMIEGDELNRLRLGNVLDAYGTDLFGSDVTRSDEAKEKLERLAVLNQKEKHGTLTEQERGEQQKLRAAMPTTA